MQHPLVRKAKLDENIVNIDDDGDDTTTNYYGFVRSNGTWYIMNESKTDDVTTYLYFAGDNDGYDQAWIDRATHSYGKPNETF